jgi:predicted CopG family antitoxin
MSKTVSISDQLYEWLSEYRDAGDHTSLDSAMRELYHTAMRSDDRVIDVTQSEHSTHSTNEPTNQTE